MKLVKDKCAYLFQTITGQQAAQQHPLGQEQNPGAGRYGRLKADSVAHLSSRDTTPCTRHKTAQHTGGHPAGLQHPDLPVRAKHIITQKARHQGGLSGPGRSSKHQPVRGGKAGTEILPDKVNRQHYTFLRKASKK